MDRLHLIPSPAHQECEEDCQAGQGDCDGTRDDGITLENDSDYNMQHVLSREALSQRVFVGSNVRGTRNICVCGARGEVFCLHSPTRARHSLMSVREIKKNNRLTGKEMCIVAVQEICTHSFHSCHPCQSCPSCLCRRYCHCRCSHQVVEKEDDACDP